MVKNVHENNEFCLVKKLSETACWLVNANLVKEEKTWNFSRFVKLVHVQGVPKEFPCVLMWEINYRGHD
jgi:hypothetical protein